MAFKITADCTNCHICVPECPNEAIVQGPEIYEIITSSCTECVGFHDEPQCVAVCPLEACITSPELEETEEALIAKAKGLHPDQEFPENFPSRHKK